MHATTRSIDDVNGELTGGPTVAVTEDASQYMAGDDRSYAEVRIAGIRRRRLVGFSVWIPLWALSAVPLARELFDGQDGASLAAYLAVGAISLGVAAVIRGVYVSLTKRRFWSPWVFGVAAVLAIAGYMVQSAGEEVPVAAAPAIASEVAAEPGPPSQ